MPLSTDNSKIHIFTVVNEMCMFPYLQHTADCLEFHITGVRSLPRDLHATFILGLFLVPMTVGCPSVGPRWTSCRWARLPVEECCPEGKPRRAVADSRAASARTSQTMLPISRGTSECTLERSRSSAGTARLHSHRVAITSATCATTAPKNNSSAVRGQRYFLGVLPWCAPCPLQKDKDEENFASTMSLFQKLLLENLVLDPHISQSSQMQPLLVCYHPEEPSVTLHGCAQRLETCAVT
ncbi:uncharacterized protein LOC142558249 isoform X2 [Dermacentor variabilis]|uniref:uncharacterized protein LOC142558249 isoform X2 n=1 Tax=Dermacentor variabilis TaxID=34621 RepID=UPI003F5AFA24